MSQAWCSGPHSGYIRLRFPLALAIVQCKKCGAVTPNAEVLRRRDWLLPCPPPCEGEREIVEINEVIEDRRWRRKPVAPDRRRPLPA